MRALGDYGSGEECLDWIVDADRERPGADRLPWSSWTTTNSGTIYRIPVEGWLRFFVARIVLTLLGRSSEGIISDP